MSDQPGSKLPVAAGDPELPHRRRRRASRPVPGPDQIGTDLISPEEIEEELHQGSEGDAIAEGQSFAHPEQEFEHWHAIRAAVFDEFVKRTSGRDKVSTDELRQEDAFMDLVNEVLVANPIWQASIKPIDQSRLISLLRTYQFGYGPLEDYMRLEGLEELYFNNFDQGYYIRNGAKRRIGGGLFRDNDDLVEFVKRVAMDNELEINQSRPNIDATLRDGSRLNATLEPLAVDGPDLVIRKHRDIPFTVEELLRRHTITPDLAEDIANWVRGGLNIVVSGGTASGKAQPLDAKILTPERWTTMGEISEGDVVIGSDGRPTKVEGVFDQGEKEIFEVVFADGSRTQSCAEHLWAVTDKKMRHQGKEAVVKSLAEIREDMHESGGAAKWSVPRLSGAVEFNISEEPLPLDPYLLGALLGDGCFVGNSPMFSTADLELLREVALRCPAGVGLTASGSDSYDWRLSTFRRGKRNALTMALKELGIYHRRSHEKFIPEIYLRSTADERWDLLRGVCDTDGYLAGRGAAEVSTTSYRLAVDLVELARSLGCRASLKNRKKPGYMRSDGDFIAGRPVYRVRISVPDGKNPFRLTRKAKAFEPRVGRGLHQQIVDIRPVGRKEARCISVAAEDGLYVTDDYVVTHNTSLLNALGNGCIPAGDRLLVIENRKELQIYTEDTKYFQTREDATRGDEKNDITVRDEIRWALRKRPDRIIVGELRGGEAFDALTAWNSGHNGSMCTIHANSAREAISKLEQLCGFSNTKPSEGAVRSLIAESVDIVVQIGRNRQGLRQIVEVIQVLHPYKHDSLRPKMDEWIEELKEKGVMFPQRPDGNDIWVMPLYRLGVEGTLQKISHLVPLQGKDAS